jgi:hypothetical protein
MREYSPERKMVNRQVFIGGICCVVGNIGTGLSYVALSSDVITGAHHSRHPAGREGARKIA